MGIGPFVPCMSFTINFIIIDMKQTSLLHKRTFFRMPKHFGIYMRTRICGGLVK